KEKALKSQHEKVARFEKQLNESSSKKEFDALQLEIAHGKLECSRLEDEILTTMSEGEEKSDALPEPEKALTQARQEASKIGAEGYNGLSGERFVSCRSCGRILYLPQSTATPVHDEG